MRSVFALLATVFFVCTMIPATGSRPDTNAADTTKQGLQLGNFSVSLTVKDINASKAFYEKIGFQQIGGDVKSHYVIMQNQTCTIGLFQGMLDKNTLTFNPGWDRDSKTLPQFQDVREIQRIVKEKGLTPVVAAEESGIGPAFMTLVDPDGNPILIDQHVPKPAQR